MDFKLNEKCSKCAKHEKKTCKGYQFSVEVQSFYCPKFKESK